MDKQQRHSFEFVVSQTMEKMRLSRKEAIKRVQALLSSGIMQEGGTDDRFTQLRMENFLRFDLSNLVYEEVFKATLTFPELVAIYDKMNNRRLTRLISDIRNDKAQVVDIKEEIEAFDKFFALKIWNYFPGVTKYKL